MTATAPDFQPKNSDTQESTGQADSVPVTGSATKEAVRGGRNRRGQRSAPPGRKEKKSTPGNVEERKTPSLPDSNAEQKSESDSKSELNTESKPAFKAEYKKKNTAIVNVPSKQLKSTHQGHQKPALTKSKTDGHSILAADIIEQLNANSYECLICCGVINRQSAVWGCQTCFMLFHHHCITKWSKSSDEGTSWRCPGCQFIYLNKPVPKCYCGKLVEPPFNPYIVPHSCGESCGKMRVGTDCPHPCSMMCHPGHCPPCGALGPLKYCFCGTESYRLRCGEKSQGKSCEGECGKVLSCGKHECIATCHAGPCAPCTYPQTQKCYCGRQKEEKTCGTGTFDSFSDGHYSCSTICDKLLSCGNHKCQQLCHPGDCGSCPHSPEATVNCPCGKIPSVLLSSNVRKKCTDPIPTCPNVCGKRLSCSRHCCDKICHVGPCGECKEEVKVPCKCKSSTIKVSCLLSKGAMEQHQCNKICKAMRTCKRHQCGKPCCSSSLHADPDGLDLEGNHICPLVCSRKLRCGNHTCDLLCHKGGCPPCHVTRHEPLLCDCGKTKLDPPILCGTKLPVCGGECRRPRPCGHDIDHTCHSSDSPCPLCAVLVLKECMGNHGIKRQVPCYQNQVSCGRQCNRELPCGAHLCKRGCHSDPCVSPPGNELQVILEDGREVKPSCGQNCGERLQLCSHSCVQKCHPGRPCPKVKCRQMVKASCPCKRRTIEIECLRGGEDDSEDQPARELECDNQCAQEARVRQLNEALGFADNGASFYPDLLIQLGRASPPFILKIEKVFEELVSGSGAMLSPDFGHKNGPKWNFPPMDNLQRRIVHEIAKYYQIDTESFDREPVRSVVATRRKESKIPPVLLSKVVSENGKSPSGVVNSSGVPCTMHIYDLTPDVKTHHLMAFLNPFEGHFQLKWLDDLNALVFFKDRNKMQSVMQSMKGHFHCAEYRDESVQPKIRAFGVPKPLPTMPPSRPSWTNNQNSFRALSEERSHSWLDETENLAFKQNAIAPSMLREIEEEKQRNQQPEKQTAEPLLEDWELVSE